MQASCRASRRSTMEALALVGILSGCAGFEVSKGLDDVGGDGGASTGADTGDTGGSEPQELGQWWALDADLVLAKGQIELGSSSLRLRRLHELEERCLEIEPLVVADRLADPESEWVWAWWRLDWSVEELDCFQEGQGAARAPVGFGLGALHPELRAALPGSLLVQVEGGGDALLGAYLMLPDDDRLLVYGVAGTEDAFAGAGEALTEGVLPDGALRVRTVFALPLEW